MNINIIFIFLLSISIILCSCNNTEQESSANLKQKELELKEKELELKEKEMLDKKEADLDEKERELDKEKEQLNNVKRSEDYTNTGSISYSDASQRLITPGELRNMSKYQLKIMRNEIFARHGYIFKTDDMRNYFSTKDWYIPRYYNVDNRLSSIEKKNIELIKNFE